MIDSSAACFAQTYAQARSLFLRAAADAGLTVQSHPHPRRGRDGEILAMDVARLGPPDATALLVLSSACHGVEGFCGSGAQVALLRDATPRCNEPARRCCSCMRSTLTASRGGVARRTRTST
jgi:hypothetical protein